MVPPGRDVARRETASTGEITSQMEHPVLQSRLPSAPWMVPAQRRLPGVQPLDMSDWLLVDEAYAGRWRCGTG
jgi:hypothetical protein